MTKKEFDTLMKIMGNTCNGYKLAQDKISKAKDYKSKDEIEKHKAYLSEIVALDLKWRDEITKFLWNTKYGKILAKEQNNKMTAE